MDSTSRAIVLAGSIFGVIAIILMIAVAAINASFASTIGDFQACATYTKNSTSKLATVVFCLTADRLSLAVVAIAPLNQPYTQLEGKSHLSVQLLCCSCLMDVCIFIAYGIKFYGNDAYFTDAGDCEIEKYDTNLDCYCTNSDARCTTLDTSYSCKTFLNDGYHDAVEASYIIAIIAILVTAAYTTLTCIVVCCPTETMYRLPNNVQGEIAVPTTAVVQPTVVSHDAEIAMATVNHNDDFHQQNVKVITAELVQPVTADARRY
jgi:hypothetical protein